MKRTPIRALALAALALTLTGCGPDSVPEPRPVQTAEAPRPVVGQDQLDRVLTAVTETLAAADAASDPAQLAGRVTGPAATMRVAEYELARLSAGGTPVTPLVTDAQVAIVGATSEWPRVVQVVTTIPEGTNFPLLMTLVQADPRANYELWSWVQLLPGTEMPPTVNPATGSPQLPPDASTLLASPQDVLARYVEVLNDGASESAALFADDEMRARFARDLATLSGGAAEAGTAEQRVSVADVGTYALGTHDGGAIVVGAIQRSLVLTRTVAGATLTAGANLVRGGETNVKGSLTATYLVTVAFHVPAAGSTDPIELIGVEQALTSVERDDSVSPD